MLMRYMFQSKNVADPALESTVAFNAVLEVTQTQNCTATAVITVDHQLTE